MYNKTNITLTLSSHFLQIFYSVTANLTSDIDIPV